MAKKKISTPKARTKAAKAAAKTKKTTEPKSNVKILEGKSNKQRQKIMNAQSTAATQNAKSGTTAQRYADERDYEMRKRRNSAVSRIKTVKVRSGGTGRGMLPGGGGLLNTKNR